MKSSSYRRIIVVSVIGIALAFAIFFLIKSIFTTKETCVVRTGDEIGELVLIDSTGEEHLANDVFKRSSFVFYISDHCSPCIDKLPSIQIMCSLYDNVDEYDCIIIWRDKIPERFCNDSYNCYSIKNKEISSTTPMFYVIESSKISFATQDFNKFVKKTFITTKGNDLQQLFYKTYNPDGNVLFVFLSDDDTVSSSFSTDENVIYIVSDDLSIDNNNNYIYDPQGYLSQLFDVKSFPSILNNASTINFIG